MTRRKSLLLTWSCNKKDHGGTTRTSRNTRRFSLRGAQRRRQKLGRDRGPGLIPPPPRLPAICAAFCDRPLPARGPGLGTNQAISRPEVETNIVLETLLKLALGERGGEHGWEVSGQEIPPSAGEQSRVLWGPLGKGPPLISLRYAFHSSAKSTKSTFLLTLPITPQALSSQESYFLALDPTWRQKPHLLGDCELEVGNEK